MSTKALAFTSFTQFPSLVDYQQSRERKVSKRKEELILLPFPTMTCLSTLDLEHASYSFMYRRNTLARLKKNGVQSELCTRTLFLVGRKMRSQNWVKLVAVAMAKWSTVGTGYCCSSSNELSGYEELFSGVLLWWLSSWSWGIQRRLSFGRCAMDWFWVFQVSFRHFSFQGFSIFAITVRTKSEISHDMPECKDKRSSSTFARAISSFLIHALRSILPLSYSSAISWTISDLSWGSMEILPNFLCEYLVATDLSFLLLAANSLEVWRTWPATCLSTSAKSEIW